MQLALVFSAAGDFLLEILEDANIANPNPNKKALFILGLLFFLIAHVLYIYTYYTKEMSLPLYLKVLVLGYYSAMMILLIPKVYVSESELVLPICVYGIVIASMAAVMMARMFLVQVDEASKQLSLIGDNDYHRTHMLYVAYISSYCI